MRLRPVFAFFLLVHFPALQAAEAATFKPALFATGERSLTSLVQCPSQPAEQPIVWVFCQGQIDSSGEVRRPYCMADGDFPEYQKVAKDAFGQSRFDPAEIDGRPVAVYASIRLAFQHRDGKCAVGLLPNKGYLVRDFGLLYVEPQEIIENTWNNRDRTSNLVRRQHGGILITLSSEVDATGKPSRVKVEKQNSASRSDLRQVTKNAEASRFIPGFVDGKPTAMKSYEYFYVEADPLSDSAPSEGAPAMSRGNP